MKHEQQVLIEKHKQLQTIIDMNDGQIPLDIFQRLTKDEFIRDNPKEVKLYKTRAAELLKEVERISNEIQNVDIKNEVQKKA